MVRAQCAERKNGASESKRGKKLEVKGPKVYNFTIGEPLLTVSIPEQLDRKEVSIILPSVAAFPAAQLTNP
jgi:hypothetical protein